MKDEKVKEYNKQYYAKNKKMFRKYYAKNKKRIKAYYQLPYVKARYKARSKEQYNRRCFEKLVKEYNFLKNLPRLNTRQALRMHALKSYLSLNIALNSKFYKCLVKNNIGDKNE